MLRARSDVINGGIINAYGTNARLGSGDWMVVEADESDGTFVRLPSTMGIVTNIDPEHLEHYGSFDNLRDAFVRYMQNIPFYGAALFVSTTGSAGACGSGAGPPHHHLWVERAG